MSKVLTTRMSSGGVYVSPSVKTIKLNSEGVVCISFAEANKAGRMLEENDKYIWDF